MKKDLCAVITGDIVGFKKFTIHERQSIVLLLDGVFRDVTKMLKIKFISPFELYRGDSFQGVLKDPKEALKLCIFFRASLRYFFNKTQKTNEYVDARLAIGIGEIDFFSKSGRAAESDGLAFRRSGPVLDKMKTDQRLVVCTSFEQIDRELEVECALFDIIINKWSIEQAQAIMGQIRGLTQEMIAKDIGISQSAVQQRLCVAGGKAVEKLCDRYEYIIGLL